MATCDVLCIGDIVLDINFLIPDRSQEFLGHCWVAKEVDIRVGGSGYNTAVGCSRLGNNVVFVSNVGNTSFIPLFHQSCKQEGLDYYLAEHGNGCVTGVGLVVPDTDITFVTYKEPEFLLQVDDVPQAFSPKVLFISGFILQKQSLTTVAGLVPQLRKNNPEMVVVLDPCTKLATSHELTEILDNTDVVLTNTGREEPYLSSQAGTVIIKRGVDGSTLYTGDQAHHFSVNQVLRPVDPSGAGDAFNAVCVYGIVQGWSWDEILPLANKAGAMTTQRIGASPNFHSLDQIRRWEVEQR